jgi:hypothetical protein
MMEKRKMLEQILKVWRKYPQLRFGQLITNVLDKEFEDQRLYGTVFYYMENNILLSKLKALERDGFDGT